MFERTNYISWDDFFMLQAKLITLKTNDNSSEVGFVIADKNKRVILHGNKRISNYLSDETINNSIPEDTTLYVTTYPSVDDAKTIINSKIRNIVYSNIDEEDVNTLAVVNFFFTQFKVKTRQYIIKNNVVIPKNGPAYIDQANESNEILNKDNTTIDNWDDYWIAQSKLVAQRSKDPATQVGSVIVGKNNNVLSLGYNGTPNNFKDDEFPWSKKGSQLETKYLFVCHSELNAVANFFNTNMRYSNEELSNATLYVSLFPCNECSKLINQFGIKNVVYGHIKNQDREDVVASKIIFDKGGTKYTFHELQHDIIIPSDVPKLNNNNIKAKILKPEK